MSLLAWTKQTRDTLRGSFNSSSFAANANGNVIEILRSLSGSAPPPQGRLWLPGRFTAPADVALNSTTLTENINYFRNLTINAGQTVACVDAGPTLIVVEETLTLGAGAVLHADGRGAAPASAANAVGGLGGSARDGLNWQFMSAGYDYGYDRIGATSTYNYRSGRMFPWEQQSDRGGPGSAGGNSSGGSGFPGGAAAAAANGGRSTSALARILRMLEVLAVVAPFNAPTSGSQIGGVGGGAGGNGSATAWSAGTPGNGGDSWYGANGTPGTNGGGGGGGGGEFPCGGGGGGGACAAPGGGTPGQGGRGGGVLIFICGTLNNAGTIRANGANGSNAVGNAGGGGGGGGGFVGGLYEALTALGTLQANGGNGGTGGGGAGSGGAGGAGSAGAAKIRSGS